MSEETQEEIIETPELEPRNIITVHPAIDFQDKGYAGVWLPTKQGEKDRLFLVNSDREIISTQKTVLKEKNLMLKHFGVKIPFQWTSSSIKEYIGSLNSVDPKELFDEKLSIFESYIEFPRPEIYKFMALWTIGTYLFPIFNSYPYVYLGGMKQTGKTKALNISALLSFNSIFSASVSTSALFRLIQNGRCSLFMDETEKLRNPDRALDFRALLLQGYKRGGVVQRTEKDTKDNFVVRHFEVFSPKMLANIYGLEDILEDRCIRIIMLRTLNREIGNKEIVETNSEWQELRDKNYVFAMENWQEIKEIYETLPNETKLSSRNWELWHPILTLASFIDNNLYSEMVKFAEEQAEQKQVENMTETAEYVLVQSLVNIVEDKTSFYPVKDIQTTMVEQLGEENWLNNKWIGRAMGRLGFLDKRRVGTGIEYQLSVSKVKELAQRLGILNDFTSTQTTQTTQTTLPNPESSVVNEVSEVNVVANSRGDDDIYDPESEDDKE